MRILLAVDGSQGSEEAVAEVQRRPWPEGTTVRVFSAFQPVVVPAAVGAGWNGGVAPGLVPGASAAYAEATKRLKLQAERIAGAAADHLAAQGLSVDTAVGQGSPGPAIVREAEGWKADLVVVGSRGLTGIKRWLLGSVAQYVVKHAPCSVQVVRTRGEPDD
jgi:nucleotide-binding universal stress UspA family protein